MKPLLDLIVEKVEPHAGDPEGAFQMLVSSIDYSDYVGRIAIGKIQRGSYNSKKQYTLINRAGDMQEFKITKLFTYEGLGQVESGVALTGDIIGVAGMKEVDIGETIADSEYPEALPVIEIDEPTLSINFIVNDSPFAGREGKVCHLAAIARPAVQGSQKKCRPPGRGDRWWGRVQGFRAG